MFGRAYAVTECTLDFNMLPGQFACEARNKSRLAWLVDNFLACFRPGLKLPICSWTGWNRYHLSHTVHVSGITKVVVLAIIRGCGIVRWRSAKLCLYGTRPSCVTVCSELINICNTML